MDKKFLVDGLLPVLKPDGMVSKDVSRWLVKRIGKVKMGHAGTLDPGASGVLPILLGRATRLQDWLIALPKAYDFEITFGYETDTLDRDGVVVREAPITSVSLEALRQAALSLTGTIEQIPPIYSAVKFKGKPLYEYARKDRSDELPPLADLVRKVSVLEFQVLSYAEGKAHCQVRCSKGTYVRTLVHDLAEKVGSCGTLTRLSRTEAAGVDLAACLTLEQIDARLDEFAKMVVPMAQMNTGMVRWQASRSADSQRLRTGQLLLVDPGEFGDLHSSLTAWDRPAFLLADNGSAIGIGAVRRHESGRVAIAIRKGL